MSNETQSPSGNFGSGNFGNQPSDDRSARVTLVASQPLPSLTASGAQPTTAAAASHAYLHITLREGGAMERELSTVDTRIGKGPDNEIILSDAAISSNHALIRFDGTHHMLIDVGSRNGTYLNNQRIATPTPLKPGDSIRLGHCTLAFRPANAPAGNAAQSGQTLTLSATEILGAGAPPPPPSAPPAPANAPAMSEDVLARALVNNKLIAISDMERVQKHLQGKRLYHALIAEKLATELGLRDLMSRTFNLQPADLRAAEVDIPLAQKLNPAFLREKLCLPLVSPPNEAHIAIADPTDKAALDELKKRLSNKSVVVKLATASEVAAKLDAQFTPRLIGVMPSGEKLDVLINQSEIAIGKAPHNRVVLNDATVSSSHATVLTRDGGYSIIDLGSSNGTFVNGTRLTTEAWTMKHGDRIQLGKVMFTFRNPTETVENKTARLSLDALEEIRKRAGLTTGGTPIAAAAFAGGAAAAVPAAMSAEEREAEEEKKRKKKEEKELKEKEKSSLTSASNLSRIIAQVMGALIAIAGPIVLYYLGVFGGGNAATNGNSGSSISTGNAATVKLTQGKWTGFSSGIFGKDPEASGAAAVPGVPGLLVVDDGRQNAIVWMPINDLGKQAGELKAVPLNVNFVDAEAITYGGGYFYVITSQADPNSAASNKAFMRFSFNAQTQTINGAQAEIISDLRTFLLQNVPEIAARGAAARLEGGLDIEGMAYDPNNERILLGLRSPFIGSQAVLVPLKLINPLQPLTLNNIKVDSPSVIPLALENQGVRDITYDAHKKVFLIISGVPESQKKTDFFLWEWSGSAEDQPRKIMMLDEKYKPEGITSVTVNGQDFLMVMGDEGNYLRLDYVK
ncbi:MAG: DUF3616 domain-containing protein [Acidobacteria bacterium]|nr:DUF3616 domain-containing protein [Acidobacteriota bacterium]